MPSRRAQVFIVAALLLMHATVASAQTQVPPQQQTYQQIVDDEEFLTAEVPTVWNDVNTGAWVVDGRTIGVFVTAAPDLAAFAANSGPGVFVGLTHEGLPAQHITEQPGEALAACSAEIVSRGKGRFGGCRWGAKIEKFLDAHYVGAYDIASQCARDGGRGQFAAVELMPLSQNYRLSLRLGIYSQTDRAAFDHILHSIQVLNPQMADLHDE